MRVLGHPASRPEPPTFTLMSPLSTPHDDDARSAPTCHSCPTTSSTTVTPPFNDEHSKGTGLIVEVTLLSPCLARHVGVLDNSEQRPALTTRTPSSKPTSRPIPTTRCHATAVERYGTNNRPTVYNVRVRRAQRRQSRLPVRQVCPTTNNTSPSARS